LGLLLGKGIGIVLGSEYELIEFNAFVKVTENILYSTLEPKFLKNRKMSLQWAWLEIHWNSEQQ